MTSFTKKIILAVLVALLGCQGDGLSSQEQDFAERYRAAHQSGDVEELMQLHYLEGTTRMDQFLVLQAVRQEIEYPIASIRFEPVTAEDNFIYEHDGQTMVPNLVPSRRVLIAFDTPEQLHSSFLLGEQDGQYYFVNARPE